MRLSSLYSEHKKLALDFLLIALGSLCARAISFILLPIVMHKLPLSQYGSLSLATAFITIASALLGLGLRQALSLEYFHASPIDQKKIVAQVAALYSVIALPILFLLAAAKNLVRHNIFFDALPAAAYFALLLNLFLFFYVELLYQILQYERQAKKLTLIQLAVAALTGSCSLIFVFYFDGGITGMLAGQSVGYSFAALCALYFFIQNSYHPYAKKYRQATQYISLGLPFIPSILASWMVSSADRWVLGYYCSMQAVGIYATADLASQLFNYLILQPWAGSYLPHIMRKFKQTSVKSSEQANQMYMWLSMFILSVFVTLSIPLARIILPVILPLKYQAAIDYIWPLLMGQVFLLGSYFTSAVIQYKKQSYFLATALCIPALFNTCLNLILAPHWGIAGCAYATLISYFIYFIITYLFNRALIN